MQLPRRLFVSLLFVFFFLSGLAGLIYESIWSHYLKLFAGHAAYAQTSVLVIYMGGMALGSWLASIFTARLKNLLHAYAIAEIIVGLTALFFHPLYTWYLSVSYDTVFPIFNSGLMISLYKWLTIPLLILPQTILLGATFPLMSSGIIREYNGSPGRTISILYFVNSLGGSIGVILSGFYLIGKLTFPGTVQFAGIVDIIIGAGVIILCSFKREGENNDNCTTVKAPSLVSSTENSEVWILYLVAGGTAAASFIYEVGWIRMLSLVLGSSTHAFELMLSAFILGLALGGFWIRNRLDTIKNPVAALAKIQVAMGICAIMTLAIYSNLFYLMKFILASLSRTDQGYLVFHIYSHLICLLFMLPATTLAGMTLPLITTYLYRKNSDETTIGKVYASNTVGSIAGVLIAIHLLMPLAGLKYLLIIGGAIDMAIGLFLLYRFRKHATTRLIISLSTLTLLAIFIPAFFVKLNPTLLSSGVYRFGKIHDDMVNIFYKDGKTSSVSLSTRAQCYSLANNGKPDASVSIDSTRIAPDEHTQILLGIYPLLYSKKCEKVGIIGLGSGMTASIMLECDSIRSMDVVEIEPYIVKAAKLMGPKVRKVFSDKRSAIHIDDAKTYFSSKRQQYDIIISEPSNPWVSGVASLFSSEFFNLISRHLTPDGMLVQWLHLYEMKPELVASILNSLGTTFSEYKVFENNSDLIILASNKPIVQTFSDRVFTSPKIKLFLHELNIENPDDLRSKYIGSKKSLGLLTAMFDVPLNSDYNPILDLRAEKARFTYSNADEFSAISRFIIPVRKLLENDTSVFSENMSGRPVAHGNPNSASLNAGYDAWQTWFYIVSSSGSGNESVADSVVSKRIAFKTAQVRMAARDKSTAAHQIWPKYALDVLSTTMPHLSTEKMADIWNYIDVEGKDIILKEDSRDLLAVLKAIGTRDFEKVHLLSSKYLNTKRRLSDDYLKIFAAAHLISSIKIGKFGSVQDVWNGIGELKYDFNIMMLYNYAYHCSRNKKN